MMCPLPPLNVEIQEPRLMVHHSAEEILETFWGTLAKEAGIDEGEFGEWRRGGIDQDGNEVEFTAEDELAGLRAQRMWAYLDQNTYTVHVWAEHGVDFQDLLHLLAHELGHAILNWVRDAPDDQLNEERCCEYFARAAVMAYTLVHRYIDARRIAGL